VAHEIEAAAADSVGQILRRKPRDAQPLGALCANCATPLQGPWCHVCGQSATDYHRSIFRLAVELFGGLFEFDSRFWRTLPNLFINPARLTRDYLEGHRAPQTPPFRIFLVVIVLLFLALDGGGKPAAETVKPAVAPEMMKGSFIEVTGSETEKRINAWMRSRANAALAHPAAFTASLQAWAQRLSVLTLPISALLLGMMFFWRRGVFMFDHLIFSMHSLSFQGLLVSATVLLSKVSPEFGWLILLSPVHLFVHLQGTYGLGVFGTLARMFLLFWGSLFGAVMIALGLLLIGLYEMGG